MDSTSKLFSRLDLRTSSPQKDKGIVDMETDIVEESNASSLNQRRGSRRNAHSGSNYTEQQRRRARLVQLINDTLETKGFSNAQDEALECEQDKAFNGATKRMCSYHRPHKGSWRKKGKEQFPVFDGGDFALESKEKRGGFVSGSGPFQHDVPWWDLGQGRLGRHGYVSPHNSARGRISGHTGHVGGQGIGDLVGGETLSSFTKISNKDKIIEEDSPLSRHKTGQRQHIWSNRDSLRKNTRSRWQVRNGCTSRYNNALGGNRAKDYEFGTITHGDRPDGNLSHQLIASLDCEGRHPDKKKGKMILEDDIFRLGLKNNAELSSDRLYSLEMKEATSTVDNDNAFISSDDVDWRWHEHRSKSPFLPSEDSNCISKIEEGTSVYWSDPRPKNTMETGNYIYLADDSPNISTSHRLNQGVVHALSNLETGSNTRDRRLRKLSKGKRKCNSVYSNYGGSSNSSFKNSETSYLQSSRHVPYNSSSMAGYDHHSEFSDPVMEVDEPQSPEERFNYFQEQTANVPDHSSAKASQIESDEILACQLQEQFYHEVAGPAGMEEIDATIAWSLQQEEAQPVASSAMSGQLDHQEREESMAHLYAYYEELAYRNSSTRWPNRTQSLTSNRRRHFYGSETDLEARMMAEVSNFTGMDSGTRRNFLEALEAAFDQSNDALAESHHDFNENDYELLLALDENILHHGGASESQINSLPQSVIQSDNVEEDCAICLENPSYGDIIRRLPCLHKFHKECIDPWLRRKTSCPVCKSEIN